MKYLFDIEILGTQVFRRGVVAQKEPPSRHRGLANPVAGVDAVERHTATLGKEQMEGVDGRGVSDRRLSPG